MNITDIKNKTVGEIVTEDFSSTRIFKRFGIDFCCHGNTDLKTACKQQNVDIDTVISELQSPSGEQSGDSNIPFSSWPLDLLLDYVLKIHHRGIRTNGPALLSLLEKVKNVHGENHPELFELGNLLEESLHDLEEHLQKEENVLFPYLYRLYDVSLKHKSIEPMHCGTIRNPIRVMMMEHENEGIRYKHIIDLTHHFTTPQDGCTSYHLLMRDLEAFVDALFEHIHIENNIVFPRFEELEGESIINDGYK